MGKLIIDSPDATYYYCGSCGEKVSHKANSCLSCSNKFDQNRSFQVTTDFDPQKPLVSQLAIFEQADVSNENQLNLTKKLQVSSGNASFFYCKKCRESTNRKAIECTSCGAIFDEVVAMDSDPDIIRESSSQEPVISDDWEKPSISIQPEQDEQDEQEIKQNLEFKETEYHYAGFWRRAAAYGIDIVFVWILSLFVGVFLAVIFPDFYYNTNDGGFTLIGFIVTWLYFALWESSEKQATIGKMALSIKVIDWQGRRLSFGNASGRYFGKILSGLIFGIGFIMAAFTKHKQALHDMMSDCFLIVE